MGLSGAFRNLKRSPSEIYENYNVHYLATERNTALASGQMAVYWNRIEQQKNIFPYLKLIVVEDDNTSEICAPLDGITLPVDDDFGASIILRITGIAGPLLSSWTPLTLKSPETLR